MTFFLPGADFRPFDSVLSFQTGSGDGDGVCFDVEIFDDDRTESLQDFTVRLKAVDLNVWVVGNDVVTVCIEDDDSKLWKGRVSYSHLN